MSKIRNLLNQIPDDVLENEISVTISLKTLSGIVHSSEAPSLLSLSPSASFGERLRTLRERSGMTVQELADDMGLSESTVRHYENGSKSSPLFANLISAADIFGVPPASMLPSVMSNGSTEGNCASDDQNGKPVKNNLEGILSDNQSKPVHKKADDDLPW